MRDINRRPMYGGANDGRLVTRTTFNLDDDLLSEAQRLTGMTERTAGSETESWFERRPMAETPKRIKRLLREYAAVAHEEELRRALLPVAEAFKRWESKELDSGEVSEIIHKFHQGPARDLWVRYNTAYLEMVVVFAITTGVLSRDTIPAELLDHLAGPIGFYEERQTTS